MKFFRNPRPLLLPVVLLAVMAGGGRSAETANSRLASGGTVSVYDTADDGFLSDTNPQFGKNLTIDGATVPALLDSLGIKKSGDLLGLGFLLNPAIDLIGSTVGTLVDALGVSIGIGGGEGTPGGAGAGGVNVNLLSPVDLSGLRGGLFYGGTGTDVGIGAAGLLDLGVGQSAGGGGGLTYGGQGFGLKTGEVGGGGGGLGITADFLEIDGTEMASLDRSYSVGNGTLNILGGSGGGGGLIGVSLGELGSALNQVVGVLNTALGLLGLDLLEGVDVNKLLMPEEGLGAVVDTITVSGTGTVNILGGVGGGGGVINLPGVTGLINANGADGTGSTVGNATITGGTVNVFGGAGGGANSLLVLTTAGGDGTGGRILDGTMSGGALNIYGGADGGDTDSSLLGLNVGVLSGAGGAGGGGKVTGLALSGGTVNLFAGTSADDPNAASRDMTKWYGGGDAEAADIANTGGTINLGGGRLTGTYTQSGAGSVLNLAGGAYAVTGGGSKNGGLFTGGVVTAAGGARELSNAQFGGTVATSASGAGNSLRISNADITAGGDLSIGTNVTLNNGTLNSSAAAVRMGADGRFSGTYTQNAGTLYLAGGSTAGATSVSIAGGAVKSTTGSSTLGGTSVSVTGAVTTDASGAGNSLRIAGAVLGGAANLTVGTNVTLADAKITAGQITLNTAGTLSGRYEQSGAGTLLLAGGGAAPGAAITLAGGTVKTGTAAGALGNATITGDVTLTAGAGTLTLNDSTITGGAFDLGVGSNVVLNNTSVAAGAGATVTLGSGGTLTGRYLQNSAGATLVLAGGNAGTADLRFSAGALRSDVAGGTLTGADFLGTVAVTASAGKDLTLTGSTIGASALLDIGSNVTLAGSTNVAAGRIILGSGGKITGTYTQTAAGELYLNGGSTAGASVTLSGGTVATQGGARTLDSAVIRGAVNFDTTAGALTLSNATLETNGSLALTSNLRLGGNYTQTGGTLNLSGDYNLDSAGVTDSFAGGFINADETATLTGANIAGAVTAIADSGKTLTLTGVGISSGTLNVGSNTAGVGGGNVVLDMTGHTAGTVTLNRNGSLAPGFTQSGGDLILAGGSIDGAGSTFTGGSVASRMTDGRLNGATFGGTVTTSATEGNRLTIGGANIEDGAVLDIGARVVLDGATRLTGGQLTLSAGGSLEGTYSQDDNGVLLLDGGDTTIADITLSGGTVRTDETDSSVNGATIDGDVTLTAGAGRLTLNDITVNGGDVDLDIGNNVVLNNTAVTDGKVTLGAGGGITGTYDQGAGAELVLDGGAVDRMAWITNTDGRVTLDSAASGYYTQNGDNGTLVIGTRDIGDISITVNGGRVESWVNGATLDGAILQGERIELAANRTDGAADSDMTLRGTIVDGGLDLIIGDNVTMIDNVLMNGTVTVDGTSDLEGSYTQYGGNSRLILSGGSTDGQTSARFIGGHIDVQAPDATLRNVDFEDETFFELNGNELTLDGVLVELNGKINVEAGLTLDGEVTLASGEITLDGGVIAGGYAQLGGSLTLGDGGAGLAGAGKIAFTGGTVIADGAAALDGANTDDGKITFDGSVDLDAGGGSLSMKDVVLTGNADVELDADTAFNNTTLSAGLLTLNGGELSGAYTQDGGKVLLKSGDISGLAGVTFTGGSIESQMTASLDGIAVKGGVSASASGTGSLGISGTAIADANANLKLGNGATLSNSSLTGGRVTLAGTGKLGANFTQSGGSLALGDGASRSAAGVTFNAGTITSLAEGAELTDAEFTKKMSFAVEGEGSTLTLSNAEIALADETVEFSIGSGVTLNGSTLTQGRLSLDGTGALAGAYTQDGGVLVLNGGSASGAKSTFNGGEVHAMVDNAVLDDVHITSEVDFDAAGGSLTLSNVHLTDNAELDIKQNVTLLNAEVSAGEVTLAAGSTLAGAYTQEEGGTLNLNGGTTGGAKTTFKGGEVHAMAGDSVLNDVHIENEVDFDASAEGTALTLSNVHLDGLAAEIDIKENVTLIDMEVTKGAVRLGLGSTLAGAYTQQEGGTLNLAGGTTGSAKATFAGGEVHALVEDAILNDVHVTGEVDFDAVGEGSSLTLTNVHIAENGIVDLKANVTLRGAEMEQGEIILTTGSDLGGYYQQSGGKLTMAGGRTEDVTGSEFSGGTVVAAVEGSVIKLAKIVAGEAGETVHGTVDRSTDTAADLVFVGTRIEGGKLNLAANATLEDSVVSLGGSVTLEDGSALAGTYTQSAGALTLSGGDASKAALSLSGGAVRAGVTSTLGSVEITAGEGSVSFTGGLAATLGADTVNIAGGVLSVGTGAVLAGATTVAAGGLILDGGAITGGGYEQTGGTLLLRSDSFAAASAAVRGGTIIAAAEGGATMRNVAFLGEGIGLGVEEGGALTLVNARIDEGGAVDAYAGIAMDVTIAEGGLRNAGGDIVMNGIAAGGQYTQESGTLALAGGVDTEGGTITLRSGTVIAADGGEARLHGASVIAGAAVAAGESGGTLRLASLTVDGGSLRAGAAVESLTDMSVKNAGVLSVGRDSVLAGATTLDTLGGIRIAGDAPGGRATVGDLRGNGGVLYFNIDLGAGVTDYYVVEESEGEHFLAITASGGGAAGGVLDLLTDVADGATYAIAGNGLQDGGALLIQDSLSSRVESDGSRIWSLGRETRGLSSSAEGVGNAPAISLAQVTTGMDELGRRFRNIRATERGRQSRAAAMANSEGCECVEPLAPEPMFSVWAGSYTHHMAVDAFSEVSMNMHGLDIGFERRFDAFVGGAVYAGVVMGGQWLNNLNIDQSYSDNGRGNGKAMSLGAYALWMNSRGWFADLATRFFWTNMDLTSYGADNRAINYAPGRRATAASAEFGRRISFGSAEQWHVEPSVGLLGSWMESDSFMANGTRAEYGVTKSLQARAGVEVGYTGERLSPYAEVSFINGFDGRTAVRMAGENLENDPSGARIRASLGATVRLTDNLSLSFDAAYEHGASFRDINGNLGIGYSW